MSGQEDDESERCDEEELDGMDVDDGREELDIDHDDDSDEKKEFDASNDEDDALSPALDTKDSNSNDAGRQNPKYLELLSLLSDGKCDTVRFVGKGGKTFLYDFNDRDEGKSLQKIIDSPPPWVEMDRSNLPQG